jgi:Protein of unknown function (DUF998)
VASGDQRRGAVAGVAAPLVFLGGLALLDALAGRVEVSDHELGPRALLMHAVFLATGLLVLAFALALGQQLAGRRSAGVTRFFVGLFGVGALLGTVTPDPDEPHTWHGLVHFAGFLLVTLALLPAMVAFALAVRGNPRWRRFGWASAAAAVATAVVVFAPATSTGNDYALWTGPASMLELVLVFGWIGVVALRLLALSRADRVAQNGRPAATAART